MFLSIGPIKECRASFFYEKVGAACLGSHARLSPRQYVCIHSDPGATDMERDQLVRAYPNVEVLPYQSHHYVAATLAPVFALMDTLLQNKRIHY